MTATGKPLKIKMLKKKFLGPKAQGKQLGKFDYFFL